MMILNPDLTWPIGMILWTEFSENPSKYLGGTWIKLTDFYPYASNELGFTGENSITLASSQMPPHKHNTDSWGRAGWGYTTNHTGMLLQHASTLFSQIGITETGGGEAHNNMPYSRKMFCWKRTA